MIACSIRLHELAHADAEPAQVQQRIRDDLAGPVIGDLPAAIHRHDRDLARHEHVLPAPGLAEREHRIVLDHPELVGVSGPRVSVNACIARQTGS